ncbi:unnamed protein product [Rhizoctonia solani]|uniref:NACHT domain-containing protein n=1 Tax=Rhizoctonia solani TaxID=456999 RepID=A0A8H3HNV5_9AGAM|nr:unnamed protein product [Rhizoctonia solani]
MSTFLQFVDSMEGVEGSREEYKELASELMVTIELLKPQLDDPNYDDFSMSIAKSVESIASDVAKIKDEQKYTIGRRHVEIQDHHRRIKGWWDRVNRTLRQLHVQLHAETNNILKKAAMDKLLKPLRPSKLALYSSDPKGVVRQYCTEGTRKQVFQDLDAWYASSSRLMWMNGMAGTGKTTIAYTYAKVLSDRQKPVACFFCFRTEPECRDVRRIVPTIVRQLAELSKAFRGQLCDSLKKNSALAGSTSVSHQFEHLLEAPFKGVSLSEDIVVIIDALDECDEQDAVKLFLEHLVSCAEGLPLKFLVTSRPEPWIHGVMKLPRDPKLDMTVISLHDIDKKVVQEDIRLYLEQKFKPMSSPLSDEQLTLLVEQCGTLFIYAVTLVRYIKPGDESFPSEDRLDSVLRLEANAGIGTKIDQLYSLVLKNALQDDLNTEEKKKVQTMLNTVLCAKEPASIKTIAALCGLKNDDRSMRTLSFTLKRLRSVIYLSEIGDTVSVFHASFPDFMFDPSRAGDVYCDRDNHNRLMARQCFGLMEELRFNICKLDSSYITDKDAITPSQIDETIQPTLWYACRYWAEHLAQTADDDLCSELKSFLSTRLLFWMEVLNLKREIALGGDVLLRAGSWLTMYSADSDLNSLAEDARNFVMNFAANPVSTSTPHIYISLLPLCSRSSAVFKCYRERFQRLLEPDHPTTQLQEVASLVSWKLGLEVLSVAFSHDGDSIAFGCSDGTVGVRSYGGADIFIIDRDSNDQAHREPVWSVAFSPPSLNTGNQVYVASGSDDGTIRIWNLRTPHHPVRSVCGPTLPSGTTPSKIKSIAFSPKGTIVSGSGCTVCIWDPSGPDGKLLVGPLEGHTKQIWAVGFSPNGDRVASGSDDYTIRVWDPKTGEQLSLLSGHQTDDINTIAFSPDGTRLASGSSDRTICIWDLDRKELEVAPFPAHGNKIQSLKFSPDGKHLASSSLDRTIQVWNPLNGKLTAGPFEGHIGPIYSIAFSPDSTRIASGSADGTIQLWDPKKGALADTSLGTHFDGVASVAFSPAGQYMASCSYDATLRVWDISNDTPVQVGEPFRGHSVQVMSLAFSPDGARVVTGSVDGTARVWDIHNEPRATDPIIFKDHKGTVRSVAFSPDGAFIVSAGMDTMVRRWDSFTGLPLSEPLEGHTSDIKSITVSPDGTKIASGSSDTTIRIWDLGAKSAPTSRTLEGHTKKIWSVAYSPDGTKLASSSSDGTVRIWDPQDGSSIIGPINVYNGLVPSVAFSPDGKYVATGADNSAIRFWDSSSGKPIGKPYEGHRDTIWSVAFSPNDTRIASGSHDGTIRIWDVSSVDLDDGTKRIMIGIFEPMAG